MLTIAQVIDRPDPRRSTGKVYDYTAADDLADILRAYAEILERHDVRLTPEGWRKVIEDAIAMVEGLVP